MTFIPEYRPAHKEFASKVRQSRWLGLIPLFLTLLLMWAAPGQPGPGLWSALGTSAGLNLMLWSAMTMVKQPETCSALGQRMARAASRWFPGFLFSIQTFLSMVTLLLLWYSIRDMGLRVTPGSTVLLYVLLALFPAHRLTRELVRSGESAATQKIESCLRYLKRGVTGIFVAMVFTLMARDAGGSISEPMLVAVVAVWSIAILAALTALAFLLDRLLARPRVYSG